MNVLGIADVSRQAVIYLAQFIYLFTGVFSTCVAQFIYYEGAGDQRAMLLPLCNYLGFMLVGLFPAVVIPPESDSGAHKSMLSKSQVKSRVSLDEFDPDDDDDDDPDDDASSLLLLPPTSEILRDAHQAPSLLIRRQTDMQPETSDTSETSLPKTLQTLDSRQSSSNFVGAESVVASIEESSSTASHSPVTGISMLQTCIFLTVFFDFGGCIFSNVGLSMAGSGLFQVMYSSTVGWSAVISQLVLKKHITKDEWIGIGILTFGLVFSASGQSDDDEKNHSTMILIGCLNTLIGAGFYGSNYVIGEYTLNLPERPSPHELCARIGQTCVGIIMVYMICYVMPNFDFFVTSQVRAVSGSPGRIVTGLVLYTFSQLTHAVTYFIMLGHCGAVTTGVMQSIRAVSVFGLSSVIFCAHDQAQCYDTKKGIATFLVVIGVLYYSFAKARRTTTNPTSTPGQGLTARTSSCSGWCTRPHRPERLFKRQHSKKFIV